MEIGKVPESVLKRSIFKQIHTKRPEVLVGAGVGEDCAAMELAPGEVFVFSTDPITGTEKNMGSLAVQITANDLASAGAEPVAMLLTVLLPPSADEPLIRTLMQEVDEACGKLNIQIMGGHTEITAVVNQPVISVMSKTTLDLPPDRAPVDDFHRRHFLLWTTGNLCPATLRRRLAHPGAARAEFSRRACRAPGWRCRTSGRRCRRGTRRRSGSG